MTDAKGGGLSHWQERRAKELLLASLVTVVPMVAIAADCRLSIRHFTRAFRHTTGVSPHRWLIERRVERAQVMMADERIKLTEIASACGFADQSHFTRAFKAVVGMNPSAWRRLRK